MLIPEWMHKYWKLKETKKTGQLFPSAACIDLVLSMERFVKSIKAFGTSGVKFLVAVNW